MDVGSWVPTAGDGTVNFTLANLLDPQNASGPTTPFDDALSNEVTRLDGHQRYITEQAYRDFTTTIQVLILIGSLLGNITVLWCTCRTSVFKSVTSRFIKNLACSGICAGLVCVPFDVALGASPRCCWWLHTLLLCKAIKFLHKLFCSVTVLSFAAIALDRYYSVLFPLERKISDVRSRDLVIYMWIHATVASVPVFAVTNVTDVYATTSCSAAQAHSLGHMVYVLTYNITTVILPLVVVFTFMVLIRRALSASQKKKVIIAALRTPQNSISIPYVSQREAELHVTLLAVVLAFSACSAPYGALVVYRTLIGNADDLSPSLRLTATWLPKVSLLTNPLLFLTVNRSARRCLMDVLTRVHRRYSRRNMVSTGAMGLGLESEGAPGGSGGGLEGSVRSGSQLLEMFNIGQQQIFRATDEEEEVDSDKPSLGSGVVGGCSSQPRESHQGVGGGHREEVVLRKETQQPGESVVVRREPPPSLLPKVSTVPVQACTYTSSSQVAPATPTEPEDVAQFGFGPFELPPHWLPETRNSKKRLLPPLGNTPEELIQTKQPRPRPERRISRNNKVSTFPTVDG